MREHWREFGFWRWWWRTRVPVDAKILISRGLFAQRLGVEEIVVPHQRYDRHIPTLFGFDASRLPHHPPLRGRAG
jgi:hypothetical protein